MGTNMQQANALDVLSTLNLKIDWRHFLSLYQTLLRLFRQNDVAEIFNKGRFIENVQFKQEIAHMP